MAKIAHVYSCILNFVHLTFLNLVLHLFFDNQFDIVNAPQLMVQVEKQLYHAFWRYNSFPDESWCVRRYWLATCTCCTLVIKARVITYYECLEDSVPWRRFAERSRIESSAKLPSLKTSRFESSAYNCSFSAMLQTLSWPSCTLKIADSNYRLWNICTWASERSDGVG